ncbi:MAG: GWxTD domain-containing protein [bacterium]|nr:GWxTD domain-containing protein [bacterium]
MKKLIIIFVGVFTVLAFTQTDNKSQIPDNKVKYYQDFISFRGTDDKARLDYFVQVPYNAVQFVKTGQGFEASYMMTVSVFDQDNEKLITEKVWNEKIVAISFELTNSPDNFNLGSRSFELSPGVYSVKTTLLDKDSKNEYSTESKINIKQFNELPSLSDIMLISGKTVVDGKSKIVPNVSRNIVTDRDALSMFYEIYSDTVSKLRVDYEIFDENEKRVYNSEEKINIKSGSNQIFHELDSLVLDLGKNLLTITLKDSAGKVIDSSRKTFVSRWKGVPVYITDLDKAIDQMIYLANPEDLSYIKEPEERIEKAKRFVGFWKKQDPNPADEYNPVFNEYYNRVAYANQNFTTYSLEGWRSDRGMVLIILGAPDNIDRHPFEYYAKPYEVWQYYNLNKQFIFTDYSGFGDYRLDPSTPLYGDLYRFRY